MRKLDLYLKSVVPVKLAGILIFCVVLWGCVHPDVDVERHDQSEGGFTVRFSFLMEGAPAAETVGADASAAFGGLPSRSVLPGSFTPPVAYKINVRPQDDAAAPVQTAYLSAGASGSISIPSVIALTVAVYGYSAWDDTSSPPEEGNLILQKTGINFDAAAVASGLLQIKLNPLIDIADTAAGAISLKLAWPAGLDFDSTASGPQGITKVRAVLYDFTNNTLISGSEQNKDAFPEEAIGGVVHKTTTITYSSRAAGAYKLRLTFFRAVDIQVGYFTEAVTVWPDSTANKWVDATGTQNDTRLFTMEEFYSAAAAVDSISVKKGGEELPATGLNADGSNKAVKVALSANETLRFKITYDAAGEPMSGKSLKWVKAFVNGDTSGSNLTGFAYAYEGSGYVSNGDITVPSGLNYYRIDICIQAPDRVTTKTYSFTFGTIMLGGTPPSYYVTLSGAIGAAASTDANAPDVITVLENVNMTNAMITAIAGVWPEGTTKHIKITTPLNTDRQIKRTEGGGGPFFTISNPSSLTLEGNGTGRLTLDGGAVWTGGSITPPSPAFGAANNGLSGGTFGLIQVKSGTLNILDNVSLQNNDAGSNGGAIHMEQEGTIPGVVTINGANTVIAYNKSIHQGGGILLNNSMTLNLINGVIHDNRSDSWHGGGGVRMSNNSTFTMSGGVIQDNTANSGNGNGVYIDGTESNFTMSGAARIDSNNDVYLDSGRTITIGGGLTTSLPAFAAVIKPVSYSGSVQALSGDTALISANHNRFGVMPDGSTSYDVNSAGQLVSRPAVTVYWLGAEATEAATGKIAGSSGTFVIPAGKTATVFMVGGGGGGETSNGSNISRGGGGGEVITESSIGPGVYPYQIGQGGNGGIWDGGANQPGGNTIFGSYTASGGQKGSSLPDDEVSGADGTICPFAASLTGFAYGSYTLDTTLLKYGAEGGNIGGTVSISYAPGDTGGGTASSGYPGTAGNGTFYGAGGGGGQGARNGGAGHKGVIFVKFD